LIQTTYLSGTKPTDTTYLKGPVTAAASYDVLSGTPLKDVFRELEKYGRDLRNIGGCPGTYLNISLPNGPQLITAVRPKETSHPMWLRSLHIMLVVWLITIAPSTLGRS